MQSLNVFWKHQRRNESRGFVSARILKDLVWDDTVMIGSSFVADCGKFKQILKHEDVYLSR